MAKSLRSKAKRKMRGVKRERYAKKELDRLKDMIKKSKDVESEIKELFTETVCKRMKTGAEMKAEQQQSQDDNETDMMDTSKPKPKVDPVTLKTENGNYPVWMNQRQVRKKKKEQKKIAKERARKKRQKV